jgi:hypothetical protein
MVKSASFYFKLPSSVSLVLAAALFFFISCDRPDCVNTNRVFDQNKPESMIYKDELINELKSADAIKITYWLKTYEEKYGREYLVFHVQGDGICALMEMEVNDWTGLEDLREKKGVSYRGAEFKGLEYEVKRSENETQFVYKTHERIID